MHFYMNCLCEIGEYKIGEYVESILVEKSWDNLTDTAVIRLPKLMVSKGGADFKEGDPVTITMGYSMPRKSVDYNIKVFTGFISKVNPSIPLEVSCEDYSYWLKKINLKETLKETSLEEVVNKVVDEANKISPRKIDILGKVPTMKLRQFRFNNENGAQVFARLRNYGLVFYFRGNKLYAGFPYHENIGEVAFDLGNNVVDHQLKYEETEEDVHLIVSSKQKDNTELVAKRGKESGNTVRVKVEHITDQKVLEEIADAKIKNMQTEGYKGYLRAFFIPYTTHGMTAEVTDKEQNRVSSHVVDRVQTTFGQGIRQKIQLGIKI